MNDYSFGNFLCMLREKNGMTQAEVADRLGVTPAAVSKWENGSSKPRVEILFQLARLLGVRAEELMCGHHIQEETLDPEVMKQINERYLYLMRVDSYNTAGVKSRRLLAWIIDWNIIGFSVTLLVVLFAFVMDSVSGHDSTPAVVMMLVLILLYPICFVLRDLIFGGRSLGKRILGLTVLDRQTGTPAKAVKCVLRNVFLLIAQIDSIIMLVSGTTLGDRAAHTVVVRKDSLDATGISCEIAEMNKYALPKRNNTKKTVLLVVCIAVLVIVLFVAVIQIGLSSVRDTQEYIVAYNYLVESQAFAELEADGSKIWHNSYSRMTRSVVGSETVTQTVEIGFMVKGRSFLVVCHKQDDVWVVCDGCTGFD